MSEIEYKVILIGDSGAGKTCFFRKLTTGIFYEKSISTIGIDRKYLNINFDVNKSGIIENKNFNINIYDTAGQERFRSLTKSYFSRSNGILIIYDITNRQSFENVKNWVNSIKEFLGDYEEYVVILIGNKSDLIEDNENNSRKVKEEEAKEICINYDLIWGGEISIKTIDMNELKELFLVYVKKIYEKVRDKPIVKLRAIKMENDRPRHVHRKACC